ncbi:MAG: hypothetical protein COB02_13720 [Candidatus Cloacimonadota bacterium]|nr:MAG: hypothetical protein COB02_13720 [Candidatus Cloacimonadota bacterium]
MPIINDKQISYQSLSEVFGINSATLRQRVKRGMSIQDALLTPLVSNSEKGKRRVKTLKLKLS